MAENNYQIQTYSGTVIDRDLSYEEVLMYLEDPTYSKFCFASKKESDQNDRYSM